MNIVETRGAAEVLDAYWDGVLPVRPANIAKQQGIEVFHDSNMQGSGLIRRLEAGHVVIVVNANDPLIRQRFTIAHELGHYNLGHLDGEHVLWRDDPSKYLANIKAPKERDANDFAANLLMPADAISFVIQSGRARTVDDLRSLFNVSEAAMRYRLMNLGYLS